MFTTATASCKPDMFSVGELLTISIHQPLIILIGLAGAWAIGVSKSLKPLAQPWQDVFASRFIGRKFQDSSGTTVTTNETGDVVTGVWETM